MQIPFDRGDVYSSICDHFNVETTEYNENGTAIVVELDHVTYNKYQEFVLETL